MSGRQTIDYDPVEALLDQGRRDLAAGQPEKARWCFEEVLRRRPTDARALLGMSYVDRHSERPIGDGASILSADLEVVKLVKDKRYDEALDLLRRELLARPGDEALQKSITHLQRHIKRRSGPPPAKEPVVKTPIDQGRAKTTAKSGTPAPLATTTSDAKPKNDAASAKAPKPPPKDAGDTKDIRPPKSLLSMSPKDDAADAPAKTTKESKSGGESRGMDAAKPVAPAAAPTTGVRQKTPPAPRESDNDLNVQSPMMEDLGSSGGVRLADEVPSGPALGSLPPAPAPLAEPASSGSFWLVLLVVVAVAVVIWALRA